MWVTAFVLCDGTRSLFSLGGGGYRNHKTEVMQITEVLRQCDRIRTIVWGGVGQDTTEGMIPGNPVLCLS